MEVVDIVDVSKSQRLTLGFSAFLLIGSSATSFAQTSNGRAKAPASARNADATLRVRTARKTAPPAKIRTVTAKTRTVTSVVAPVRVRSTRKVVAPVKVAGPLDVAPRARPRQYAQEEMILLTSGALLLGLGRAFRRRHPALSTPEELDAESGARPNTREFSLLWHD